MASINQYKTAKGRAWRVQYRDPAGKVRTKRGFPRKSDARAWADKNSVDVRAQDWINPNAGKITVGELGDVWVESRTHLKPSTLRVVKQHWRNHVKPRWGDTPVGSVAHSDVQAWVADLSARRSPTIVRGAHNCLSQIMAVAVADGRVKKNPAAGVKLPKKPRGVKVYLTVEQVAELAKECSRHGELVWLLATSGLRFGEAAALRPCDLDPLRGRIHITRNAVTVGSDVVIGTPKTGEYRSVAVAEHVMGMLLEVAQGRGREELIWQAGDGGPLHTPGHGSWFDEAVKRARAKNEKEIKKAHEKGAVAPAVFPRVTPHGLRHVAAGLLVQSGANVKVVQNQLGHSSASMTLDVYSDLFDDGLDSVASALDSIVAGENVAKMQSRGAE